MRESWRQFVSTSIDGLCRRRLEAQILDQLGVDVSKLIPPRLGGRDLLGRAVGFPAFSSKEGGLTIADARDAAGI